MTQLKFIKKHFLAGILVMIPFFVVGWILLTASRYLWSLHTFLPPEWQPEHLPIHPFYVAFLNLLLIVGIAIVLAISVSALGWASKQYLGERILDWFGDLIQRIPVIRSIYSALDQLLKAIAPGTEGQQFSRVVYIEFPRKGTWTLAFVTGVATGPGIPPQHLNVFVPTTPNPTSGFYLIVPESEIRESQLKVEEAFKTLLSLGIAKPEEHRI